jgi:hypothetical protein
MSQEDILMHAFERYDKFLKSKFTDNFDTFKTVLEKTQALISGGSVLHYLFDNKTEYNGDIDIYINVKNSREMRNFIASLPNCYIIRNSRQNRYNQHFLKINNIKKILQFKFEKQNVDLVYIQNKRSVESVVTNFDFTCCQNYYDGKEIKSTHLDLTLEKKYLINDDFKIFYQENTIFTQKRVNKYHDKGFTEKKSEIVKKVDINPINFNTKTDYKEINVYDYIFGWTCNYKNFVPCRTKKYFEKYFFNKYTSIKPEDPELVRNNKFVFYSDDVDRDDFNSLDDYKKIDMYDNVKDNIQLAVYQIIMSLDSIAKKRAYESSMMIKKLQTIKESLTSEFGEDLFRVKPGSIPKTADMNNSRINITLPLENSSLNIGQFIVQSRDNVIFTLNNKHYGFDRDYIYRLCITRQFKIYNTKSNYIYQLFSEIYIFKDDVNKIKNPYLYFFEVNDCGYKFRTSVNPIDYKVYNLNAHSMQLFKDKYC